MSTDAAAPLNKAVLRGATAVPPSDDPPREAFVVDADTLKRRECAQSALYEALGFDYNEECATLPTPHTAVCKQVPACVHTIHITIRSFDQSIS